MKIDVQDLDADFLVFSGHKMFAPLGIGVLYGKKELLNKMTPFLMGGDMIEYVYEQNTTFAPLPNKFEAGTQNVEGVIGLGSAIDYIEKIGYKEIQNVFAIIQNTPEQVTAIGVVNALEGFKEIMKNEEYKFVVESEEKAIDK